MPNVYRIKVCPVCGEMFRSHRVTCSLKCGHAYRILSSGPEHSLKTTIGKIAAYANPKDQDKADAVKEQRRRRFVAYNAGDGNLKYSDTTNDPLIVPREGTVIDGDLWFDAD